MFKLTYTVVLIVQCDNSFQGCRLLKVPTIHFFIFRNMIIESKMLN